MERAVIQVGEGMEVLEPSAGTGALLRAIAGAGVDPADVTAVEINHRLAESLRKALAARVPIICAVSAPSSLAVEFARTSGQTLIGFLREGGMNIYSFPERVRD